MLGMASKLYNYTPDELQKLLDESSSYKELLRKLGMCDHGSNYTTLKKVISEYDLDLTAINKNREILHLNDLNAIHLKNEIKLEDILVENSTYNNGTCLKKRLFKENLKEYKCESCGLKEWQGQPIPLQLHHKNGIHNDNRLENLMLICPNCHALTDTFAGKNIKTNNSNAIKKKIAKGITEDGKMLYDGYGNYKILCPVCNKTFMNKEAKMCRKCYDNKRKQPKVSKEELFKIMQSHSYTSAADLLGVDRDTVARWHMYYVKEEREKGNLTIGSDKAPSRETLKQKIRTMSFVKIGKEYNVTDNSIRRWCDAYNLPRKTSDIKKISDEEWDNI